MSVAALFDIHGNLPALEAVLVDIAAAHADRIVVGGDVTPGPMPRECLERLLALDRPVQFIRGNGDRETLSRMQGVETASVPEPYREAMWWCANELQPDHDVTLASWPLTVRVEVDGLGPVLFCHATPRDDNEIFTKAATDEELRHLFGASGASVVVCGHTHMAFDRRVGDLRVVNAGSVGMPFGSPGAYWALLGPDVELRRTEYDLTRAAGRIRRTRYPRADEFAERNVLDPPSEASMLELFSRVPLKMPQKSRPIQQP